MPSHAKTWIEVSRAALRHNAAVLRRHVAPAQLMAVVKADAYGHGLELVVKALGVRDAAWLGVDSLEEAVATRAAGAKQPILILGYVPMEGLEQAVRAGFSLTIYDRAQLKAIARAATARRPAKVHVKIETGTSRQGVMREDWRAFALTLRRAAHVVFEGLSTHYANIEDTADSGYAMGQLRRYEEAVAAFAALGLTPTYRHTAASAAALLHANTHLDLVRAGIALYGLWPSHETLAMARQRHPALALHPALTWKARVAQVKALPAGTPVSYGLTEKVTRASRVAVIPVGYYDGLPRALSSVGHVLIRGHRAKILGRVCMNMCVVDVTDVPGARAGDVAVLLGTQGGESLTAEELARQAGTINYEIVARLNPLIARRVVA